MGGGRERGTRAVREMGLGREDGRETGDTEDKRGYRDKRNKVKMVSKFFKYFFPHICTSSPHTFIYHHYISPPLSCFTYFSLSDTVNV